MGALNALGPPTQDPHWELTRLSWVKMDIYLSTFLIALYQENRSYSYFQLLVDRITQAMLLERWMDGG